jgi:hypothetical protein
VKIENVKQDLGFATREGQTLQQWRATNRAEVTYVIVNGRFPVILEPGSWLKNTIRGRQARFAYKVWPGALLLSLLCLILTTFGKNVINSILFSSKLALAALRGACLNIDVPAPC